MNIHLLKKSVQKIKDTFQILTSFHIMLSLNLQLWYCLCKILFLATCSTVFFSVFASFARHIKPVIISVNSRIQEEHKACEQIIVIIVYIGFVEYINYSLGTLNIYLFVVSF